MKKYIFDCNIKQCRSRCCGIVPIPIELYLKYKHKIKSFYIKINFLRDTVLIIQWFLYCAFLDKKNYQCLIYNERPDICRLYGNGKHKYLTCKYLNKDLEHEKKTD